MNIIETHNLCKQYGNALRVAHLDLRVPEGMPEERCVSYCFGLAASIDTFLIELTH